jgi:flagellar motility protein MotE (MotC chaperone)
VRVLQSLGERRKQLDARAADIDAKATLLEATQKRMDERVAELKRLEASIQSLMQDLDAEELERITALVSVYQRMRAKDAAAVFNGLEEPVLVEVASRMKQQNLAEIMGAMAPDRARRLTILLAQHKKPPATAAQALQSVKGAAPPAAPTGASGPAAQPRRPATAG